MSIGAPSPLLAPLTSRQRLAATFLMTKAPVLASAVMVQLCCAVPWQSWISTPVRLPRLPPQPVRPKHLFVFAFIVIFQMPEPAVAIWNFCWSPPQLEYCCTLVRLFCEPEATSSTLPLACMGARL